MPKLTKSQAERLLREVDAAGEDGVANRRAVGRALALVLGPPVLDGPSCPGLEASCWPELVHRAARHGGWEAGRTTALLEAVAHPDRISVLVALWDLAAELSELRSLGPPA